MTAPHAEPLGYRQIADELRGRIASGDLAAGERMPSEKDLAQRYGVAALTARRAMQELRWEGLIVGRRGFNAKVREVPEQVTVKIPRGSEMTVRHPTPAERVELGVPGGVWVAEVVYGGRVTVYLADRTKFTFA